MACLERESIVSDGRRWCVVMNAAAALQDDSVLLYVFSTTICVWRLARAAVVLAAYVAFGASCTACVAAAVSCSKRRRLLVDS